MQNCNFSDKFVSETRQKMLIMWLCTVITLSLETVCISCEKWKNKYIVRKNGKSAVLFGRSGTTFCAKNRIIKLFLKFIDFEKKI